MRGERGQGGARGQGHFILHFRVPTTILYFRVHTTILGCRVPTTSVWGMGQRARSEEGGARGE